MRDKALVEAITRAIADAVIAHGDPSLTPKGECIAAAIAVTRFAREKGLPPEYPLAMTLVDGCGFDGAERAIRQAAGLFAKQARVQKH